MNTLKLLSNRFLPMMLVVSMPLACSSAKAKASSDSKAEALPQSARWVIHVDVEKFMGSKKINEVLTAWGKGSAANQKELDEMRAEFEDIAYITLFGSSLIESEAVVIIGTKEAFAPKDLKEYFGVGEKARTITYNKRQLFNASDPEEGMYWLCFYDPKTILCAKQVTGLLETIDALDGKVNARINANNPLYSTLQSAKSSLIVAAGYDLDKMVKSAEKQFMKEWGDCISCDDKKMGRGLKSKIEATDPDEILEGLRSFKVILKPVGDEFETIIDAKMKSDEVAKKMQTEIHTLIETLKAAKFKLKGDTVQLKINSNAETLLELLFDE